MFRACILLSSATALGLLLAPTTGHALPDASGYADVNNGSTFGAPPDYSSSTPVGSQISVDFASSGASASAGVSLLGWGSVYSSGTSANNYNYPIQPNSWLMYYLEVAGPTGVTVPVNFTGVVSMSTSSYGQSIFKVTGSGQNFLLNELCWGCGSSSIPNTPTYQYIGNNSNGNSSNATNSFSMVADLPTNEQLTVYLGSDVYGVDAFNGVATASVTSIGIDPSFFLPNGESGSPANSPADYTLTTSSQISGVDAPEPISLALLAPGLFGLLVARRRGRVDVIGQRMLWGSDPERKSRLSDAKIYRTISIASPFRKICPKPVRFWAGFPASPENPPVQPGPFQSE